MTKGQLKEIIAALDTIGILDSVQIRVKLLDSSRVDLGEAFILERQDAEYATDASGHYAPSVSQSDAVVLKQV